MQWDELAKNILKSEIKKHGLSYKDLSEKLSLLGIKETAATISHKINKGRFQFVFFLQCANAMGIATLRLDEIFLEIKCSKS
jgi:hypothetical protein